MSSILPQDIIINLSRRNPIKEKYFVHKRYNNFKEYIKDLESARRFNSKDNYIISIIYTEEKLKSDIDDIKRKYFNESQNNHLIIIHFEQYNTNKIQFISDYICNIISMMIIIKYLLFIYKEIFLVLKINQKKKYFIQFIIFIKI